MKYEAVYHVDTTMNYLICVLTSKSVILIYDMYGTLVLEMDPSIKPIAKFTTNPSTDGSFFNKLVL